MVLLSILLLPTLVLAQNSTTVQSCNGQFNVSDLTSGDILIPPFLRTSQAAQSAGFDCIGAGIQYYTALLFFVIGLLAFFYLLYGAFTYMTAFGEEAKAEQAKKIITQAIIGLVLAVLATTIVSIVQSTLNTGKL